MKEYYFLTSSVTTATKGEKILSSNGFRAFVFRDGAINPYGCGYVIKAVGDRDAMADILKKRGVRINEIREVP